MQQNNVRAFLFLVATCAVSTIAFISDSQAYPGDVFTAGAPLKGPSIQRSTEIPTGTYSVSQSTGAAQYTFPIVVPPGRAGMAPSVALNYSSQNPLHGGIAAGWTLNTISIEIDTSGGRLRESSSSDRFLETIYKSGLAGGQRLVKVPEPGASAEWVTLRAENDAEYVRYEYPKIPERPSFWRALHPNGRTFYFGETPESRDGTRWFLTRVVDQFNNAIVYTYEKVRGNANSGETLGVPIDIALTSVEYTKSPIVHNAAHARVLFKYAEDSDTEVMPCPGSSIPRGARFTYRSGVRTQGDCALMGI